jgi:hypothetical protein
MCTPVLYLHYRQEQHQSSEPKEQQAQQSPLPYSSLSILLMHSVQCKSSPQQSAQMSSTTPSFPACIHMWCTFVSRFFDRNDVWTGVIIRTPLLATCNMHMYPFGSSKHTCTSYRSCVHSSTSYKRHIQTTHTFSSSFVVVGRLKMCLRKSALNLASCNAMCT